MTGRAASGFSGVLTCCVVTGRGQGCRLLFMGGPSPWLLLCLPPTNPLPAPRQDISSDAAMLPRVWEVRTGDG